MHENNQLYTVGESPADVVYFEKNKNTLAYIKQYSWRAAVDLAAKNNLNVYFIDYQSIERSYDLIPNQVPIFLVPKAFVEMPDSYCSFFTSINFIENGPFKLEELAYRAHMRLFNWDMFVYPNVGNVWKPARENSTTHNILEKYFPLKEGDTGPAGGFVIDVKEKKLIEVSPVDAGWCKAHDAQQLCIDFSHNGYNDWRLPSVNELKSYAGNFRSHLRKKYNVYQTTQTTIHWSSHQRIDKATAIVTQENEDTFLPPYTYPMGGTSGGYHKSKNGPWLCDEKEHPVTDWLPVRPVRDL